MFIFHSFHDVALFAVYVTACDFDRSFSFDNYNLGHVRFRLVSKLILTNTSYISEMLELETF